VIAKVIDFPSPVPISTKLLKRPGSCFIYEELIVDIIYFLNNCIENALYPKPKILSKAII
jgi:hypothetical protein